MPRERVTGRATKRTSEHTGDSPLLQLLVPQLLWREGVGLRGPHAGEAAEAGHHEADDLVVVGLLGHVVTHGAERLVQDGHEHVDDHEGHRHHEQEHKHLHRRNGFVLAC